jgi:flagellar operon protein
VTDPRLNIALTPGVGAALAPPPAAAPNTLADGPAFSEVLDRTRRIQFSKHALQRVERRDVQLDAQRLERLNGAVDRAAAKGSREAVVFLGQDAFVVSVANRTVITAVPQDRMRDHVFTNIDSAVIA